jgi:hypothetical protein
MAAVAAATISCPGRSAVRSSALQTRDPGFFLRFNKVTGAPDQLCTASGAHAESAYVQDSLAPARPIRLFERPEPIDAIAAVPDGPPVQFIWRRVRYVVAHAEGPERIEMEWWRDEAGHALTRDYFRVESHEGVRVWLYRQGLFNDHFNHPSPPTWFLHGVFA